jgi:hypothetical protein
LGQNQKKKNLKGLYENIEGQTQISRRKERKKKKKKKKKKDVDNASKVW